MDKRELDFIEPISSEEIGDLVWSKMLEWLNNNNQTLAPDIRDLFVEQSGELRLRMQALFIEIQRRFMNQVAGEAEFEEELRRDIRSKVPYMSIPEKLEALKVLQSTTDKRMDRLEAQLAGFDFFNTVLVSVQAMSDTKVSKNLAASVKNIPSARRQQLLAMLNDLVKKVEEPIHVEATIVEEFTPDAEPDPSGLSTEPEK